MIDHLLVFSDKNQALKLCPDFINQDGDDWDFSISLEAIVFIPQSEENVTIIPGYWLALSSKELDKNLQALPQCRIITDRDAIPRGENHFLYLAPDLNLEVFTKATVSPVFLGSDYTF